MPVRFGRIVGTRRTSWCCYLIRDGDCALVSVILSFLVVFIATAVYLAILWRVDRYEHEPLLSWWVLFLWGLVPAAGLALLFESGAVALCAHAGWGGCHLLLQSDVLAPLVEEIVKGLALLLLFLCPCQEMDTLLDGIVYGALVGFGFAASENFLYLVSAIQKGGWGQWFLLVLLRQFVFGLNHAFFTSFTGLGLVLGWRFRHWAARWSVALIGLLVAMGVHSFHNFSAMSAGAHAVYLFYAIAGDYVGIVFLFLLIGLMWRRERRIITGQLATEVGVSLDSTFYQEAIRFAPRLARQNRRPRALRRLYRHFYDESAEVAFTKDRMQRRPDEVPHLQHKLERTRRHLRKLQENIRAFS